MEMPISLSSHAILLISLGLILCIICLLGWRFLRGRPDHNLQNQTVLIQQLIAQQGAIMQQLQNQAMQQNDTLGNLNTRLVHIGEAQKRLESLGQDVNSLQDILSNKQARGKFGEIQLMDIVKKALPANAFRTQVTLSNRLRVDCLLDLPHPTGAIAVDSKFPLEYWQQLHQAQGEAEKKKARTLFISMMQKHLKSIAEKYMIPGETADIAILFLPSEAIYAEIHAEMPEIIATCQAVKVYITAPSTLMATLNTMRAILRDASLREETHIILQEVTQLTKDIALLDRRVGSLKKHYDNAVEDMRNIQISNNKIVGRAEKMVNFDAIKDSSNKP